MHKMTKRYLIGIGGGSGAGTTTAAYEAVKRLRDTNEEFLSKPSVEVFPLDMFYHDQSHLSLEDRALENYDHPNATSWGEVRKSIALLLRGEPALIPRYNFKTHTRDAGFTILQPSDVIILEGNLALFDPQILRRVDAKIYLWADKETCLERRIARDKIERKRSRKSVIKQWNDTVYPMFEQFVSPTKKLADAKIQWEGQLDYLSERLFCELLTLWPRSPYP